MNYREYLNSSIKLISELDTVFIEKLSRAIEVSMLNKASVYVIGNGGSASTAAHFVCNISKNNIKSKPRMFCLTDNVPILTALANDNGYDNVFRDQLKAYLQPKDLLIAISGSGNSENILNAVDYANICKNEVYSLTGFNGGTLATICSNTLIIKSQCMEQIEDIHVMVMHLVSMRVLERLQEIKY